MKPHCNIYFRGLIWPGSFISPSIRLDRYTHNPSLSLSTLTPPPCCQKSRDNYQNSGLNSHYYTPMTIDLNAAVDRNYPPGCRISWTDSVHANKILYMLRLNLYTHWPICWSGVVVVGWTIAGSWLLGYKSTESVTSTICRLDDTWAPLPLSYLSQNIAGALSLSHFLS